MRGASPQQSTPVGYIHLQGKPNQLIPLKSKFKFGRSEIYSNSAVSRNHFTIARNDGGLYYLIDQGSRTGTRVNGNTVPVNEWVELSEGSQITCGPYVFIFTVQQEVPRKSSERKKTLIPPPPAKAKDVPYELKKKVVTPSRAPKKDHQPSPSSDHKNDNTFLAAIASINIIIYACFMIMEGTINPLSAPLLVKYGGNIPYLTTGGEWWRLFCGPFLHVDIWHLIGNVAALYFATVYIIQYLTPNKIIVVYLGSAFIASLMSALMNPVTVVSVGASGAIFGLYGALLVSMLMYRNQGIKLNPWLIVTIIYFVYDNLGWGVKGVGYWAHAGGFGAGAVITYMCLEALPENDRSSSLKLYGVFATVVLCAVMILPVRKMSSQQQMGYFFGLYAGAMDVYYTNLSAYENHRNVGSLERVNKEVMKTLDHIDQLIKKEEPVDQRAEYYRKQLTYVIAKTKSHSFAIMKFVKTGNQKYVRLAKREDEILGRYGEMMSKEFGFVKEKSPFQNQVEIRSRHPATR